MSDYLPSELWPEILVKLPIRSVIQCTIVCKQWRSIITSSGFISDHLRLSRQNNPLLLTPPTTIAPQIVSLHFDTDDSPLRLSQTLHGHFPIFLDGNFTVVGSVDGLVLLCNSLDYSSRYSLILWNPSIRKSVTVSVPVRRSITEGSYSFMLGFGIDSATSDYKVVRLVYLNHQPPGRAEVYSLRDRSWRTVLSSSADDLVPPYTWTQCFIHGAVHWIGGEAGENQEMLLFDLGTEEFKKMALPRVQDTLFSGFVVGGLLAVSALPVIRSQQPKLSYNIFSDIDIWVKRDYYTDSWTKIARLDGRKVHVGEWLDVRRVCWEIPTGSGGGARDCREIQVPPPWNDPPWFESLRGKSSVDRYVFSYTECLVLLDEEDKAVKRSAQHWRRDSSRNKY